VLVALSLARPGFQSEEITLKIGSAGQISARKPTERHISSGAICMRAASRPKVNDDHRVPNNHPGLEVCTPGNAVALPTSHPDKHKKKLFPRNDALNLSQSRAPTTKSIR
jgi:hypothetical protein